MVQTPENKRLIGARIRESIIPRLKHLAIDLNRSVADLLEEAILDLLRKYQGRPQPKKKP